MKHKPPCGDCPDKGCGRHGKCEKYLEFRARQDEIIRKKELGRQAGDFLAEATIKTMRRNGKK
jgi:hypothetical protein